MIIRLVIAFLLSIPMAASANLLGVPFSFNPIENATLKNNLFILDGTNIFLGNVKP